MSELSAGQMIEGRYRIDQHLAAGGQGHVYKGTHLILGRTVAIKTLRVHSQDPRDIARVTRRFEQEAILLSQLRDPHTITLYDFGKLPGGLLFMVFEFINGQSLRELLAEQGTMSPYRVAKVLKQALMSLQEAHTMDVLHRDIKPANMMIYAHAGRSDQVKILDFGIAKALGTSEEEEALTSVGNIVGTPRYIAPEIFKQVDPSPASDLYSLGLVAYEMLTGKPAIEGTRPIDIMRAQFAMTRSKRLPTIKNLTGVLRHIIEKMLQLSPKDRYGQCAEVLFDLQYWDKEHLPSTQQSAYAVVEDEMLDTFHDDIPTTAFDPSQLEWLQPEAPMTQILSSDAIPNIFSTMMPEGEPDIAPDIAQTYLDEDPTPVPRPMSAEDGDRTMILTELPPIHAPAAILKRKKIKKHIREKINKKKSSE